MTPQEGVKYLLEMVQNQPNEPIFIFRGRDKFGSAPVRRWIRDAEQDEKMPKEKAQHAS